MHDNGLSALTMTLAVLFWLVLLVVIGALAIWFFTRSSHKIETPMEILRRRYARGEITKEEYERMKRDLEI